MITLCGYEEFKIMWLNSYCFTSSIEPLLLNEKHTLRYYNNQFLYIADDSTIPLIDRVRKNNAAVGYDAPEIASRVCNPKPGQTLYFDKWCTIPRIKCASIWKRTTKLSKADVVVIPNIFYINKYRNVSVFLDSKSKTIYIVKEYDARYSAKTGQTLFEWYELNKHRASNANLSSQENIDAVRNIGSSVCIYTGDLYYTKNKYSFIFDVINGNYSKFISENKLMGLIDNEDNKFTKESIQSIIDLLSSSDKESVHQGMRILANLDYIHFPIVTSYILNRTRENWSKFNPFNSTVQFMLKNTKLKTFSLYLDITNKEIELLKDFIIEEVVYTITNSIKHKYCFQDKVDIKCEVDVTIKDNETLCNS